VEPIRSAAGFEGLVVLAVIYFVINLISRAGKKTGTSTTTAVLPPETTPTQAEAVSLESILRQIEAVKRQKTPARGAGQAKPAARIQPRFSSKPGPPRMGEVVQDARGPLGRASRTNHESAEDVEDRTSLEDEGRELEERRLQNVEVFTPRPERVVQNRDEEAEALVQRRIKSAEARNRPHAAADHRVFDQAIRAPSAPVEVRQRLTPQGLREALVWREILGPPKSLQDE
jgi:hypothetical protein